LIFLKYYLIEKNKRVDRKIKAVSETRETIYWDKISSTEDIKKTTRSIQANIIHA
jgi:hypothetical protein